MTRCRYSRQPCIAAGCARQLDFGDGTIDVSYVGGLFNKKKLFLEPFIWETNQYFKANVHPPKLSPCQGAILLALEKFDKKRLQEMKEKFLRNQ